MPYLEKRFLHGLIFINKKNFKKAQFARILRKLLIPCARKLVKNEASEMENGGRRWKFSPLFMNFQPLESPASQYLPASKFFMNR